MPHALVHDAKAAAAQHATNRDLGRAAQAVTAAGAAADVGLQQLGVWVEGSGADGRALSAGTSRAVTSNLQQLARALRWEGSAV